MADGVFNVAKGKITEFHDRVVAADPANSGLVLVLFRVVEADSALEDRDTLDAVVGAAGSTEADFTNYVRKVLTAADLSVSTVDDTNNRREADAPDQTWAKAGGAVNNDLVKLVIGFDSDTTGGTDANIIPVTHHDLSVTTTGVDLTLLFNVAGYARGS